MSAPARRKSGTKADGTPTAPRIPRAFYGWIAAGIIGGAIAALAQNWERISPIPPDRQITVYRRHGCPCYAPCAASGAGRILGASVRNRAARRVTCPRGRYGREAWRPPRHRRRLVHRRSCDCQRHQAPSCGKAGGPRHRPNRQSAWPAGAEARGSARPLRSAALSQGWANRSVGQAQRKQTFRSGDQVIAGATP